ncbi:MAG: hypothetical protein D6797_00070 [Bdellovibrio sp.]|nr:MAG: hypothetical protein D6797_00070 [Bdellovibrio sp.]
MKPLPLYKPLNSSLEKSRQLQQKKLDQKLRKASQMYEEQFLREMVRAMRKTVNRAHAPSMAEKIFEQKLDEKYVEQWGERGGIGLGEMIYRQLKERFYSVPLRPPKGPLPVEKGRIYQLKGDSPQKTFLLKPTGTQKKTSAIQAPWDGRVSLIRRGDDGSVFVRLDHEQDGVSSVFHYQGKVNIQVGEKVIAGQKLGELLNMEDGRGLGWKVTEIDSLHG